MRRTCWNRRWHHTLTVITAASLNNMLLIRTLCGHNPTWLKLLENQCHRHPKTSPVHQSLAVRDRDIDRGRVGWANNLHTGGWAVVCNDGGGELQGGMLVGAGCKGNTDRMEQRLNMQAGRQAGVKVVSCSPTITFTTPTFPNIQPASLTLYGTTSLTVSN